MPSDTSPLEFDWRRPHTFLAVATGAVSAPRQFFAQMRRGGGYLPPLAFFLATMLAPTMVNALMHWSQGPLAMLTFFASSLLKSLVLVMVFAFTLYCVCRFVFSSTLEIADVLRIVCYASGVRALEFLPLLLSAMAATLLYVFIILFVAYLVWAALQAAGGLSSRQSVGALVLAFVVMVAVVLFMTIMQGKSPLAPPADGAPTVPPAGKP